MCHIPKARPLTLIGKRLVLCVLGGITIIGCQTESSVPTSTPGPREPIVDVTVNDKDGPISIDEGNLVQISWVSENTSSCNAFGSWDGPREPSGSILMGPLERGSQVYGVFCTSSAGSDRDSVEVTAEATPTVNILWPMNNGFFVQGQRICAEAEAFEIDDETPISSEKIEWYIGDSKLGTGSPSCFDLIAAQGLRAEVIGSSGKTGFTIQPVRIREKPQVVTRKDVGFTEGGDRLISDFVGFDYDDPSTTTSLAHDFIGSNFVLSPNGRYLAYVEFRDTAVCGNGTLWIANQDGSNPSPVVPCIYTEARGPLSFSPDSKKLAFWGFTGQEPSIFVAETATKDVSRLPIRTCTTNSGPAPCWTGGDSPVFSQDGRFLYLTIYGIKDTGERLEGDGAVAKWELETGRVIRLRSHGVQYGAESWQHYSIHPHDISSDGRWLVTFLSGPPPGGGTGVGQTAVGLLRSDGTEEYQITELRVGRAGHAFFCGPEGEFMTFYDNGQLHYLNPGTRQIVFSVQPEEPLFDPWCYM